ncbi:MAG: NAD(P)H-hydrate epimerase, partial [Rhodothermales bacterium]
QEIPDMQPADLVIDAVIGYSLSGNPRGRAAVLINEANKLGQRQNVPILSLDVPSGIDTTTGDVHEPAVHASATMTLALPKEGLRGENVRTHIGELYLADISVPPALYRAPALGLDVGELFAKEDIVRVW